MTLVSEDRLADLLAVLTLEEKVSLVTGRDFWTSRPIERIGLSRMLFSDGPSGVRGESWDERSPSLNLPSATALGASWDTSIARRYGNVAAVEARRKGVDVVLGPTINLHRSPLGGRHFECLSEDPVLTAELAAAYVSGMQENGVAATPKHYIANDSESERFTVDVRVGDRALRELYLLAFEKAITEAGAWAVMSSYNAVNGVTMTENDLLETPLNSEWGFDGVVLSDWTAVRSIASARASQDLAMPGPTGAWGPELVRAVERGEVSEAAIDRKVERLLLLAARVGALAGVGPAVPDPLIVEDGVAFAREAAVVGAVLVSNTASGGGPELPWAPDALRSVAVIGHNALNARTQGGGSATVIPSRTVSPLEALRLALPDAEVSYSLGAAVHDGVVPLPLESIIDPSTGSPGALVRFIAADGTELFRENRSASSFVWFSADAPIAEARHIEISTRHTPEASGELRLGFAGSGHARMSVDGKVVLDETVTPVGDDLGAAFLSPPSASAAVSVEAGRAMDVVVEYDVDSALSPGGALSLTVGIQPPHADGDDLIAAAVDCARGADVVVIVVGTNSAVESEGYDRDSLVLPGRQDDLVRAVAAVHSRTVVVVNSGAPVELPWRDEVSAVLLSWFGGQEYGHAIADILLGRAEPGGRLPTTWPAAIDDVPVIDVTPVDGVLEYDEGIHVGYRAWLRFGAEPAWPFGHGLGYTSWRLGNARLDRAVLPPTGAVRLSVDVENTGDRPGAQVVQVYASRPDSVIDRPVRWLVGFARVQAAPGGVATAVIDVPARAFADWDGQGWHHEPGVFTLHVGTDSVDLPLTVEVELLEG